MWAEKVNRDGADSPPSPEETQAGLPAIVIGVIPVRSGGCSNGRTPKSSFIQRLGGGQLGEGSDKSGALEKRRRSGVLCGSSYHLDGTSKEYRYQSL